MTSEIVGPTKVVEGTICYPPVLGIELAVDGQGPRARLANTVATVDGESVTVVFRGDRAEVAEQLLVRGSGVRLLGVWDDDRGEFRVDRFDIAGFHEEHKYRLAGRQGAEVASDVDVSTLYQPDPAALDDDEPAGVAPRQPQELDGDHLDTHRGGRFVPGQRVVARDRGNVGTVVSVDDIPDRVRVRFSGKNDRESVVAFTSDQLDPAPATEASRGPGPPPQVTPEVDGGWGRAPTDQNAPTGPEPIDPLPPAATQRRDPERVTPEAGGRTSGRRRTAAAGRPAGATDGRAGPVAGVLRVHTRRPEPSGELLL